MNEKEISAEKEQLDTVPLVGSLTWLHDPEQAHWAQGRLEMMSDQIQPGKIKNKLTFTLSFLHRHQDPVRSQYAQLSPQSLVNKCTKLTCNLHLSIQYRFPTQRHMNFPSSDRWQRRISLAPYYCQAFPAL